MYTAIHFMDNKYQPYEKVGNPHNMAISPADIANLTAEGKAIVQHALDGSLHYVDIPFDEDLPMEFIRGVDDNDVWEAQQEAQEKVRNYLREKSAKASNDAKTE